MDVFSVDEAQKNWDKLIERVEKGEHIGIVREDGKAAVMMPADDDLIRLYTEHSEGS